MLSKKVEEILNQQIAKEADASNSYLAMASWCETSGLRGCAAFFYEQSEEERGHMMKIFKYVNEAGGYALAPKVAELAHSYKSIQHVFESALEHELNVTKSINHMVDMSLNIKDYASFNFLQWFVAEQHEEEMLFRSILNIIEITGIDGKGLLFLDNEITKIRGKKE